MVNTTDLSNPTPSLVTNGHGNTGVNGHQAAIDAADEYFKTLTLSDTSGDQFSMPSNGMVPNMGYVVNQSAPDQVYRPANGTANGDLLL